MNPSLRRFLANASFMYVNEAIVSVATILVTIKVVAALGPERYGMYATVLAFAYFFRLLTESSGVDDLVISDLARSQRSREGFDSYITTGVVLRVALGTLAFILSVTVARLLRYDEATFGLILIYSLGMPFSFHKRKNPFIARQVVDERRGASEAILFALTIVVLVTKLLLVLFDAPLAAFVIADLALVLSLSAAFLLLAAVRREFTFRLRFFDWRLAKDLFTRSLPISISGLFVMVLMRIDQVMISKMVGMEAVGVYSVAVLLTEATNVVVIVATGLLLPIFSRMQDEERRGRLLSLCFRGAAWGSLLLVVVYSRFGADILRLVWGDQYAASLAPLKVLSWNMVFMWLSGLHGPAVISMGLQRYTPLLVIVPSTVNVLLNLVLIPAYGPVGAAWATLVCYLCGFAVATLIPALRPVMIPTWREMLPLGLFVALLVVEWPGLPALGTGTVFLAFGAATAVLLILSMRQISTLAAAEGAA